jgi:hypothetical protein
VKIAVVLEAVPFEAAATLAAASGPKRRCTQASRSSLHVGVAGSAAAVASKL